MDDLIDIPEERWLRGGTPDESRIVPLGRPIDRPRDIDLWRGRLDSNLVNEAVAGLVEELH